MTKETKTKTSRKCLGSTRNKIIAVVAFLVVVITTIVTVVVLNKNDPEKKDEKKAVELNVDFASYETDDIFYDVEGNVRPNLPVDKTVQYDLCNVFVWIGPATAYHPILLKTANYHTNVKSLFFHSNFDKKMMEKYPNIEFVNIGNPEFFYAQSICRIFLLAKGDPLCKRLQEVLEDAPNISSTSPFAQLRMLNGLVFKEWLHPDRCKSWSMADADTVWGDIQTQIQDNPHYMDADLVSFGSGDTHHLYTRAQFTAHIQTRQPELVNNIWRFCPLISTMDAIINTFSTSFFGLDEGCYTYAVLQSKAIFNIVPQQLGVHSWDIDNIVWFKGKMFRSNNEELKGLLEQIRDGQLPPSVRDALGPVKAKTPALYMSDKNDCSPWLAPEYNYCLEHNPGHDGFVVQQFVGSHGKLLADVESHEAQRSIKEFPMFHLDFIKKELQKNVTSKIGEGGVLIVKKSGVVLFHKSIDRMLSDSQLL
jgi:hypothetical protein